MKDKMKRKPFDNLDIDSWRTLKRPKIEVKNSWWLDDLNRDRDFLIPKETFPIDYQQLILDVLSATSDEDKSNRYFGLNWEYKPYIPRGIAARVFAQNIRHITFSEFLGYLQDAAEAFYHEYYPIPYVMVVGDKPCKSNRWAMKLLLEHTILKDYPPFNVLEKSASVDLENVLAVYPDDGLFTGDQMSRMIGWNSGGKNVVIVGVTTNRAKAQFSPSTDIFYGDVIDTLFETAQKMGGASRDAFNQASNHIFGHARKLMLRPVVYFDHKQPDEVSVAGEVGDYIYGCDRDAMTETTKQDRARVTWPIHYSSMCPVPPYLLMPSCTNPRQTN